MKQLKKSKRPAVVTVNGNAPALVQDAETYQRLLDVAAYTNALEGSARAYRMPRREESGPQKNSSANLKPIMAYLVDRNRVISSASM